MMTSGWMKLNIALVGMRSGKRFRMGDTVRIKVVAANLAKRQLDYEWVLRPDTPDETEGSTTAKKKKHK